MVDDSFVLFFNAHHEPLTFTVPRTCGELWSAVLDTSADTCGAGAVPAGAVIQVNGRTLLVLRGIG